MSNFYWHSASENMYDVRLLNHTSGFSFGGCIEHNGVIQARILRDLFSQKHTLFREFSLDEKEKAEAWVHSLALLQYGPDGDKHRSVGYED